MSLNLKELAVQFQSYVDSGDISDGFHTFNELYRYRMLYNAAFFNLLAKETNINICKSRYHSDGKPCFGGGWFIVVAELPTGQISNHYDIKYWDLFKIPETDVPPVYDSHTPGQAADRLEAYILGTELPEEKSEPLTVGKMIDKLSHIQNKDAEIYTKDCDNMEYPITRIIEEEGFFRLE